MCDENIHEAMIVEEHIECPFCNENIHEAMIVEEHIECPYFVMKIFMKL